MSDGEKDIVDNDNEEEDFDEDNEGDKRNKIENYISAEAEEEDDEDGEGVEDSSEEESGLDEYEMDDFLVEGEIDDDNGEEEHQDRRGEEKRRKKKKKKKSKKLEKDDYLMMQENLGISVVDDVDYEQHGKYKRLKKRKQNEDDSFSTSHSKKQKSHLGSEGEEEEDEEDLMEMRRERRSKTRFVSHANDLFGDDEIKDFLQEEYGNEDSVKLDKYEILREQYEPAIIAENFFTSEDDKIRETDIPERLQSLLADSTPPNKSELEDEIDWMYDYFPEKISKKFHSTEQSSSNYLYLREQIYNILHFIRVDAYEIPYIDRYQRDHIPNFDTEDLWMILDLDEKWCHFKQRKENLQKVFESASDSSHTFEEYMMLLRDARSLDELNDLLHHFHLHHPDDAAAHSKHKNPSSNHLYRVCINSGLKREVADITISAQHLGEALEMSSVYLQDPAIDFNEFANNFIANQTNDAFPTIESVRKAIIYLLSTEIASDPKVRKHIRSEYYEAATISTNPTEVGKIEIDSRHQFHHIKRLKEKPVKLFNNEQFGELRSAEKEGLIKLTITIPEQTQQKLLKKLCELYCTNSRRENSKEWNDLRKRILEVALKEKLYPLFQKSLYQKLLLDAKEHVLSSCYNTLKQLCNTGPYLMQAGRVMTMISGQTNRDPVVCATIDHEGELINTVRIDNLLFKKALPSNSNSIATNNDFDPIAKLKLSEFIEETKPKVIVVASNNMEARKLMNSLNSLLNEFKRDYEEVATAIWGVIDIPRICSLTPDYEKEFADYSANARLAISLARYIRDPITQISLLFHRPEDIYALNLHPFQNIIDKDNYAQSMQRAVVDSVNMIGVDINRIIDHPYRSATLQFICGLGPRKAANLKQKIIRAQSRLNSRNDLNNYLDEKVFKNAAGFLRIEERFLIGDNAEYFFELDNTRIHPHDYNYAVRMIRDALNESKSSSSSSSRSSSSSLDSVDDSTTKKLVKKFFLPSRNRGDSLRKINISQSLRDFDPEGKIKIEHKLMDIKEELLNPFQDLRTGYVEPDMDALFYHLTGESIEVGQIITVTITAITAFKAITRLESGIVGIIDRENVSDSTSSSLNEKGGGMNIKDLIQVGQVLNCKVLSIDKIKFEVNLSSKGSDLRDSSSSSSNDPYLIPDELAENDSSSSVKRMKMKKEPTVKTRIIVHPLFKNISYRQAEEQLQNAASGEVIFRPSSKGPQQLTLTYKFHDCVAHVDIKEEDKPNLFALGRKLRINDEEYEDLNEIVARFIEPIVLFSEEMKKFRRFIDDSNSDHIEIILKAEKEASPHSIPYRICVASECPGRYKLLYLPNRTIKREYISCTPQGFKFRNSLFQSPEELISWFKNHWRDTSHKNPSKLDHPPPHPSSSSTSSSSSSSMPHHNQSHHRQQSSSSSSNSMNNPRSSSSSSSSNQHNDDYYGRRDNRPSSSSSSSRSQNYNQSTNNNMRGNYQSSNNDHSSSSSSYDNQSSYHSGNRATSSWGAQRFSNNTRDLPPNNASVGGGYGRPPPSSRPYNDNYNNRSNNDHHHHHQQQQHHHHYDNHPPSHGSGGGGGNFGASSSSSSSSSSWGGNNQSSSWQSGGGGGGNSNMSSSNSSNNSGGWGNNSNNNTAGGWNNNQSNNSAWPTNQPNNNNNGGGWGNNNNAPAAGGWGNSNNNAPTAGGWSNNNNNNQSNNSNSSAWSSSNNNRSANPPQNRWNQKLTSSI